MNFSFVTRMPSIPIRGEGSNIGLRSPTIAFSAGGSKFAMAMTHSRVSVWEIQSKVPLKTFMGILEFDFRIDAHLEFLQFSSGKLGKQALVFVEVCLMFTF